jgi:hypothetical protein
MALSPPKASRAGLRALQAAKRDTAASTLIHAIVTVCKSRIRRIASGVDVSSPEAIYDIMASYSQAFSFGGVAILATLSLEVMQRIDPTSFGIENVIRREMKMDSTISTKDLKGKLDRKQITVVETLAPERYREAHIPGALNIPPERIKELAPQLLPNKDAEIFTYCTNNH